MLQMLLASAGAAIGAYFGGPVGASIGYSLGSMAGSMLYGTEGQKVEGPRLQDFTVQTSTYGLPIPIVYGTVRLPGNVIWTSGIRESRQTETRNGVKTRTYTYYASWASAFAAGPAVDVLRIWADTKLVFDKTGATRIDHKKPFKFRFYAGEETQMPDPLIDGNVGAGNAPAYRGLCYIVFDDVLLTDYGNRIPNVSAEIAFKVAASYPKVSITYGPFTSLYSNVIYPLWDKGLVYALGYVGTDQAIGIWDLTTLTLISYRLVKDIIGGPIPDPNLNKFFAGSDGYGYLHTENFGNDPGDAHDLVQIDLNGLTMRHRAATVGARPCAEMDVGATASLIGEASGTRRSFVLLAGELGEEYDCFQSSDLAYLGYKTYADVGESGGAGRLLMAAPERAGRAEWYAFSNHFTGGGDIKITRLWVKESVDAQGGATYSFHAEAFDTITPAMVGASGFQDIDNSAAFYDAGTDAYYLLARDTVGLSKYLIKWRPGSGVLGWLTYGGPEYPSEVAGGAQITCPHGILLWPSGDSINGHAYTEVLKIDLNAMTIIDRLDGYNFTPPQQFGAFWRFHYDGAQNRILYAGSWGVQLTSWERNTAAGQALSDIVGDLCARAGLPDSYYTVTALTDTVQGYILNRPMPIRNALEPLTQAYFFGLMESDWQLQGVKRGGASAVTITQTDLASGEQGGNYWHEQRTQELELPERFAITYMDRTRDYQESTQHDKRNRNPGYTMSSRNEDSIQLPIVMTADEAKRTAQRWLFQSWLERTSYAARLGPKHLRLDPTDVFSVTLDDGSAYKARATKVDIGADFTIDISALAEDAAMYVSNAVADPGAFTPGTVTIVDEAQLFVLAIPVLQDADDLGGLASRHYLSIAPTQPGITYPGGNVWRSEDYAGWDLRASLPLGASYGYALTALPDTSSPFSPDVTTTLRVRMVSGTPASVSDLELVNGANVAVLGPEILQFRDVVDHGDGTYTLSYLLRGRRGTDVFTDTHAMGETLILVNDDWIIADSVELAWLGKALGFLALTRGAAWSPAGYQSHTLTGRDLKPYAPVNPTRTDNTPAAGDITLAFERRIRRLGEWEDGTGVVGLAETSESYEIDILAGPGGALKRTLTGTTTSIVYTAANVTTDFGAPPTDLYARIYQTSSVVGRGFWYEWKLTAGVPGVVVNKGE